MAISKNTQANIDDSNLTAYPNGQVKDDDGTGNGFPLVQVTTSDIYEFFDKLMRLAGLTFNNDFDNETNGYQFVQACSALASKSDYVLPITTSAGVLQIPTKLQILQLNEKLLCKAGADYDSETTIKGTGPTPLTIAITRQWKNNDYLLLVRTGDGVQIISLATADNLNILVGENNYLKSAGNVAELAGTVDNAATTPASNLYAFTQRVTNPTEAIPFLVTETTPGLMSSADKTALDAFANPVKNVGWFSGVDPGSGTVGSFAPRSGDIVSAQITAVHSIAGPNSDTQYLITMANPMADTNYYVRSFIQSEGTFSNDDDVAGPVFRIVDNTSFSWALSDTASSVQNLKIHIEVVQIS